MKVPTPAADFDGLSHLLAALRKDMASLTQSVATRAERRGRKLASDITDRVDKVARYVETRGRSVWVAPETQITTHPQFALGLAAVTGVMLGAVTRR